MKIPALLAFIDLADTGSFRVTARRLRLSPSALSTQIHGLENDVGAPLIVRNRRGCSLTPAGQQALPLARSLTGLAERLETFCSERRLTIAASSNIGTYLLPVLCRHFQKSTGLPFDLTIASNPESAQRVRDGHADCAVLEWWKETPGFAAIVWHHEPLVVIAPPDHPWTRRERLLAADLLEEPMLGGESATGTGTVLRTALGERASELRVSMRLGSTEAVKQAVMNGLGVSVVMASAVRTEVAAGRMWAATLADTALHKNLLVVCRHDWSPAHAPPRFSRFPVDTHHGLLREVRAGTGERVK